jgi:hypothetical protein
MSKRAYPAGRLRHALELDDDLSRRAALVDELERPRRVLEGEARPHERPDGTGFDHARDRRAHLPGDGRTRHDVGPPARAHHFRVAQEQAVHLHFGDRSAREADHHEPAAFAQENAGSP